MRVIRIETKYLANSLRLAHWTVYIFVPRADGEAQQRQRLAGFPWGLGTRGSVHGIGAMLRFAPGLHSTTARYDSDSRVKPHLFLTTLNTRTHDDNAPAHDNTHVRRAALEYMCNNTASRRRVYCHAHWSATCVFLAHVNTTAPLQGGPVCKAGHEPRAACGLVAAHVEKLSGVRDIRHVVPFRGCIPCMRTRARAHHTVTTTQGTISVNNMQGFAETATPPIINYTTNAATPSFIFTGRVTN